MSPIHLFSHRGPVIFGEGVDKPEPHPAGPGGVVPLVRPLLECAGGTWTYAAWSEQDRQIAAEFPEGFSHGSFTLQPVSLPRDAHQVHYRTVTTEHLAHVFHYLCALPHGPAVKGPGLQRSWPSYRAVNERFAAVANRKEVEAILIEDSHLLLLPAAIRRAGQVPGMPISYFHHIAWCEPDYFEVLPDKIGREILESLLCCDAVGFHAHRWADAFVACCVRCLPEAEAVEGGVDWRGRFVKVHVSPGRVDLGEARREAAEPDAARWRERFSAMAADRRILLRVDRADLWKNPLRGFVAYEMLLERRPDLAKDAWFLAVMAPTRTWIPEYRSYLEACKAAVERINARYGRSRDGREAVTLHLAEDPDLPDRGRALGALDLADCFLINSLFEGLPVVAFEGVTTPTTPPVFVLSRNAGVYEELGENVLAINPFDTEGTASALGEGLDTDPGVRQAQGLALKATVEAKDSRAWLEERLVACGIGSPITQQKRLR